MQKNIKTIRDVVEYQLCTGCGACAFVEPNVFEMIDITKYGKRPVYKGSNVEDGSSLKICPGIQLDRTLSNYNKNTADPNTDIIEPVLSVWQGYATDHDIRFLGSSGGLATALSLYCIEKQGMGGVLHTSSDDISPIVNKTVFSKSRNEILNSIGSKYAPASPCDGLNSISQSDKPSLFVGKPCDVAAVNNIKDNHKDLFKKLDLTISIFCAGTPSTHGLIELLKKIEVDDISRVKKLKYRGCGWPGEFSVTYLSSDNMEVTKSLSYAESWGFLQKYRQWRCYICPDHMGTYADIALGDPWYLERNPSEQGQSIIIARTERGKSIIESAINDGYIFAKNVDKSKIKQCKPDPHFNWGSLWARLFLLKIFGGGVPTYKNYNFFYYWWHKLTFQEKVQSIIGTIRRIYSKHLNKRISIRS